MKAEELWKKARRKNGFCIACETELKDGDDFALCDERWPKEPDEEL